MLIFLLFFLCVFPFEKSNSQEISFTNYSSENGLVHPSVLGIVQDEKGRIWFGTKNGISMFDGNEFVNFTLPNEQNFIVSIFCDKNQTVWVALPIGLFTFDVKTSSASEVAEFNNLNVHTIFQDKNNNVWFGTRLGLKKFDGQNFETFTNENGLPDNFVTAISQSSDGKLLFGTFNGYVSRFDGKNFTNFSKKDGLPGETVNSIFSNSKGKTLVATDKGVFEFSGKKFIVTRKLEPLSGKKITSVTQDKDENFWFGTKNGIVQLTQNFLKTYSTKDGLGNDIVNFLFVDLENNLWVATESGVTKLYTKPFELFTTNEGLSNNNVTAISEDKNGNIWFGTSGGGVCKFDEESFYRFDKKNGFLSEEITSILEDRNGNIWFGTLDAGITVFDGKKFSNYTKKTSNLIDNQISSVFADKNGNIWFGTANEGVSRFDGKKFENFVREINETEKQKLLDNNVNDILEISKGEFWFASKKGISVFAEGKFNYFKNGEGGLLPNNKITCFAKNGEDVWVGSDLGLFRFLAPTEKMTHKFFELYVPQKNENFFKQITALKSDKDGNLWLGTNSGATKFNPKTQEIRHYGKSDGFTSLAINPNAIYEDTKGRIWFGTINGVFSYKKEKDKINSVPPILEFLSLESNKEEIPIKQGMEIPYDKNSITINFTGVSLRLPEKIRYKYKLIGFDKDWFPEVRDGKANYSNLPAGTYTFLVNASNNDGVWNNEPLALRFKILQPWWQEWYFYIFSIGILTLLVWEGKRRVENKLEKTYTEKIARLERKKQIEITELQNRRYREELERGAEIQLAMLPLKAPEIKGLDIYGASIFASEVGGDYYDYFILSEKRLGFCVGDATGHGIGAGLLVAAIKSGMLMSVKNLSEIELMKNLNEVVKNTSSGRSDTAMALSYSVIDTEKRKITTVSASMPFPYFYKSKTKELLEIETRGFPLGKSKRANYQSIETFFEKGDYFILLSDGFPEASNELSKQLGYTKLKKIIERHIAFSPSAETLAKALISEVKSWMKTHEQEDDMTILIIKIIS
ncbi:SpoIIE family protein phosphatase [bacterium]|nr:SpoIIE family protein phosphatase [bacterium]